MRRIAIALLIAVPLIAADMHPAVKEAEKAVVSYGEVVGHLPPGPKIVALKRGCEAICENSAKCLEHCKKQIMEERK